MGLFDKLKQAAATPTRSVALGGNGAYDYEVVGESQHKNALASIIRAATPEERAKGEIFTDAVLVPERDNAFDPNAIAVHVAGQRVAYVSAADTAQFHELMKSQGVGAFQVKAVLGWNVENAAAGIVGVRLDLE